VLEKGQPQRFNAYNAPHEDLREFIRRAEDRAKVLPISRAMLTVFSMWKAMPSRVTSSDFTPEYGSGMRFDRQ